MKVLKCNLKKEKKKQCNLYRITTWIIVDFSPVSMQAGSQWKISSKSFDLLVCALLYLSFRLLSF